MKLSSAEIAQRVVKLNIPTYKFCHNRKTYKQEAHGPQLAHLSETATADMQMACNIFPLLSNIETYDKTMA